VSASCIAAVPDVVSPGQVGWYAIYAVLTRLLSPAWGAMGVAIAFSATEISFHPLLFWMYGIDRGLQKDFSWDHHRLRVHGTSLVLCAP
jgi:hypothetical protein